MDKKMTYVRIWTECMESLERLSLNEAGQLFMAIMRYASYGTIPDKLPVKADLLFPVIRSRIDAESDSYKRMVEGGKKGGRPKKEPRVSEEKPRVSDEKPSLYKEESQVSKERIEEEKDNNHYSFSTRAREEEFPAADPENDPDGRWRPYYLEQFTSGQLSGSFRKAFGQLTSDALDIVRSDRYPLDLVVHAVECVVRRIEQYPLGNPLAYMKSLLRSWEEAGFENAEDVEEAKKDGSYSF